MDPNETLALLRACLAADDTDTAAEAAEALDGWLSKGGYPPDAWTDMHLRVKGWVARQPEDQGVEQRELALASARIYREAV